MEVSRQNRGVLFIDATNAQLRIVGKAPFARIRPICLDSGGTKTCGGRFVMWQLIPGHPEYEVSFEGQIWSKKSNGLLKPIVSKDRYRHVFLYDGHGNSIKMRVHRAVLLAFTGPPMPGEECRHLDGNQENNALYNLTWGTRLENWQDRRRNGKVPPTHLSPQAKLKPSDIPQIRDLAQIGLSSRKIGAKFDVSHTTILEILRGNRWEA